MTSFSFLVSHAHLSGSIPLATLERLHIDATRNEKTPTQFPDPSKYTDLNTFFHLFDSSIYKILNTPQAVTEATTAVLNFFREDGCIYLELRTTPRALPDEPPSAYLDSVLKALSLHDQSKMIVRLILSISWDFTKEKVKQVVDWALEAKSQGVVGIDVCGNPKNSFMYKTLIPELQRAKNEGLKLTIHFAELEKLQPDRLGHATFLTTEVKENIIQHKRPIEICLSSNVKGGSVASMADHHMKWAVKHEVPILISTDDPLVFTTKPSDEYRYALGLLDNNVEKLVSLLSTSISHTFCTTEEQEILRGKINDFNDKISGYGAPSLEYSE
ncbi:hypothetical protein O181_047736 [Austropuccinia psidii MF-1]|uniref:Adenosine deaminase domain-containing protein n=1 Tax=Austropuccinia psidii MF-1 TaxID=1389203 RepID=A0A9Q3DPB9_9BASI|nr:hypothetical protein [Austropuccinia psidii MF-1]